MENWGKLNKQNKTKQYISASGMLVSLDIARDMFPIEPMPAGAKLVFDRIEDEESEEDEEDEEEEKDLHNFELIKQTIHRNTWKCKRCKKIILLERVKLDPDFDEDSPPLPFESGICKIMSR